MSSRAPRCATATSAGWWFAAELMDAMRYVPAGRPPPTSTESTPFCATPLRPLKNTNLVGSVSVVDASESIFSIVTCEWPLIKPASLTCCGAMWNVESGFVKWPVSRFLIASWTVKLVFALTFPPLGGNTNLADGMSALAAMTPIGVWLHEPSTICFPFVFCLPGTVRQKLMKLFVDVMDASCPAVGVSWPVSEKSKVFDGSIVSDVCASPPAAAALVAVAAAEDVVEAAAAAVPLAALSLPLVVVAPVLVPLPVDAAVAPVAAMRASRSAAVVQVTLVPAELTSGRAAQLIGSDGL